MKEVAISEAALRQAAEAGMDSFVQAVVEAIYEAIGGQLTADNMGQLNAQQITLLGWDALHEEVMDGGFIQLIHNGWGGFVFLNPFGRALRQWGLDDLATLLNRTRKLYHAHHEHIERDFTDEEFMALFEQMPEFDDADDFFVENEERWTAQVATYLDDNIEQFVAVTHNE